MGWGQHVLECSCRGQRTTCGNWLFLASGDQTPVIQFDSSFSPLSHPASPTFSFFPSYLCHIWSHLKSLGLNYHKNLSSDKVHTMQTWGTEFRSQHLHRIECTCNPDASETDIGMSLELIGYLASWFKVQWRYLISNTKVGGCPLEPNSKTLLLMILQTLVIGHEELKLVLIRKVSSCWLTFIVLKGLCRPQWEKFNCFFQMGTLWTTITTTLAR